MPTRNYWQGYTPTASLEGLAEFNRQRDLESQRRLIALKQLIATKGKQIAEENTIAVMFAPLWGPTLINDFNYWNPESMVNRNIRVNYANEKDPGKAYLPMSEKEFNTRISKMVDDYIKSHPLKLK